MAAAKPATAKSSKKKPRGPRKMVQLLPEIWDQMHDVSEKERRTMPSQVNVALGEWLTARQQVKS